MIEGSGSGRPKNTWVRIRNTGSNSFTHSHLGDILVSEEQRILGDHPFHVEEGVLVLRLIVVAHTVSQTGNHSAATGPLRGPA
jgi:hypothetical protein